jgi:hypothetical protein
VEAVAAAPGPAKRSAPAAQPLEASHALASTAPDDFYESGKNAAADKAKQESAMKAGLQELMKLGASAAARQERSDEQTAVDYAEREDLLRIEQQLVELRAKEARKRITGARGQPAAPATGLTGAQEPDESLSILAPSSFHRPALTARKAMAQFRKEAADAEQAQERKPTAKRREGADDDDDTDDDDDDDCFMDLDALG